MTVLSITCHTLQVVRSQAHSCSENERDRTSDVRRYLPAAIHEIFIKLEVWLALTMGIDPLAPSYQDHGHGLEYNSPGGSPPRNPGPPSQHSLPRGRYFSFRRKSYAVAYCHTSQCSKQT